MNLLQEIIGTVTGGGLLGWLTAMGTRWMEMKARREDHKMKLAELAEARSIEADKAKAILAQIREKGEADAFAESIKSEGSIGPSYPWINATMRMWRPGLTLLMILIAHISALVVGYSTSDWEPAKTILTADSAAMGWMIGFWFGRRDFRT